MTAKDSIDGDAIPFSPEERNIPAEQRINALCSMLANQGVKINPMIAEYFSDPYLYAALPKEIVESDNRLAEYIAHSMAFDDFVVAQQRKRWDGDTSGFFGEEVVIPETLSRDGQTRREESGDRINLGNMIEANINPQRVLFYRVTQPSETPKPEYYWTSDLWEVKQGLQAEIPREQREKAIILVADLQTISQNGGLIQDVNDDQGLAVRQIGQEPFDQNQCLATFKLEKDEA